MNSRAVIQSAHCRALSATRSTHATRAPSSASPWAMPPPMFGLVPVTIAIFPASFTRARLVRPFCATLPREPSS